MPNTDSLPLNETGTHVLTVAPSGVPWECPIGYLETAQSHGYKVVGQEEFDKQANTLAAPSKPAEATATRGRSTTTDPTQNA